MGRVIGLTGYARTGKDTVAGILVEKHAFQRVAFADGVREALLRLDPQVSWRGNDAGNPVAHTPLSIVVQAIGWETAKEQVVDLRALLQRMGTEVGRAMFGEGVWVDVVDRRVTELVRQGCENIVFTDVRFPQEWKYVSRKLPGEIWRLVRPGFGPVNVHSSETAMDGYAAHRTILNNSGVDLLALRVEAALEGKELHA